MSSSRMASSSRPMSSRSSGVRCSRKRVHGEESWVRGRSRSGPPPRRRRCAPVWPSACWTSPVRRSRTAPELQAPDAGVADAHATPVRQQRARLLAGHQQRRRPVGRRPPCRWPGSGRGRRSPPRPACGDDGPEALEVQSLGDAGALEALGQRVQQAGRTARPGLALTPVGHAPVELGDVPATVPIVVVLVQRVAVVPAPERAEIAAEDRVLRRWGDVHVRDVGKPPRALGERSQHPHDRRHAAAGRHEQQRLLHRLREHELPGRRREPDHHAPARVADEVLGHQPARDALDGDRDTTVAPARHRRERIGAPVPHAVDVDADAHVLARHVRGPPAAGPQPQRHAVARLGHHGFHAATRLARRPERVQLPEEVIREEAVW